MISSVCLKSLRMIAFPGRSTLLQGRFLLSGPSNPLALKLDRSKVQAGDILTSRKS